MDPCNCVLMKGQRDGGGHAAQSQLCIIAMKLLDGVWYTEGVHMLLVLLAPSGRRAHILFFSFSP